MNTGVLKAAKAIRHKQEAAHTVCMHEHHSGTASLGSLLAIFDSKPTFADYHEENAGDKCGKKRPHI